jgi:hypothetical protein
MSPFIVALLMTTMTIAEENQFGGSLGMGNDILAATPLFEPFGNPPYDDNGFTNDLQSSLWLYNSSWRFSLDMRLRMITERGGVRRWDESSFKFTLEWWNKSEDWKFTYGISMMMFVCGDTGGLDIQESAHKGLVSGREEWNGLQTVYPSGNYNAFGIGGFIRAQYYVLPYLSFDGQGILQETLQLDAINFLSGFIGFTLGCLDCTIKPRLSAGLTTEIFWTLDQNMKIPGGYNTGRIIPAPSFMMGLTLGYIGVSWEVRFNEGGSGHAQGILNLIFNEQMR